MIGEHQQVVLLTELPEHGFQRGDVGVIVHVYQGGAGYEVEFVALDGETVGVVTVDAVQVRPVAPREIPHARRLPAA